jgi:CrcB protein
MSQVLMVAVGGALGAMMRYGVSAYFGASAVFPWATFGINIAGSFAIGLLWGGFGHTEWFHQWGRVLLVVGVLGGFTTFSAFSLEVLHLADDGRLLGAALYAGGSVLCCLAGVLLGVRTGYLWVS